MADHHFTPDLQSFRPSSSSSSFPLLDIEPHQNMEPISQFLGLNHQNVPDNTNLMTFQTSVPFCNDNNFFMSHLAPEFSGSLAENFPGFFHHQNNNNNNNNQNGVQMQISHYQHQPSVATVGTIESECSHGSKKRKAAVVMAVSESSSMNSSAQVSAGSMIEKTNNSRRGKRVKNNEEKVKPKEVVHVRARRGQATDSHSLAERVRRGKINERLRCLQDIVPGCYKTMGMAVMLDEIINYVQSLQNQVEFLSMKLTAASAYYDFNAESDATETMQRAKAEEAKELERVMREGGYGGFAFSHSTWSL